MVLIPGNSLHPDNSGIHCRKTSLLDRFWVLFGCFWVCVCVLAGTVSSTGSGNMTGGTFIWASFLSSCSVLVTVAAFSREERASSVCVLLFTWSTCSLVKGGLILFEMCSGPHSAGELCLQLVLRWMRFPIWAVLDSLVWLLGTHAVVQQLPTEAVLRT